MKETLARYISNIFNPFVVGIVVLTLLALRDVADIKRAMEWVLISIVLSIVPVFVAVVCLVRFKKLDSFFSNPREQRTTVYILASVLGAVDCGLFWYIKAPELLIATFTAGLIAVVAFMVVNYFWKISLHMAFVSAAAVVLIIIYGANAAWSLVLLPAMGWARITLSQHSLWQVIAGGSLAVVIVSGVFWGFTVI